MLRRQSGSSATGKRRSPPGSPVLASTQRPCTSAPSATSISHTCSWMNCTPGYAAPNRSVFLWLAIDPLTKLLPVLELGTRTHTMAHRLIHTLQQKLPPFCLSLFTSDGLNLSFYALTAHFGQWLTLGRRGCNARQWQVEPGLIYGQVKKSERRRKLVRVTPMMRLGTEEALAAALQRLGLGGATKHRFYRAGSTDHPPWDSGARSLHVGDSAAVLVLLSSAGVVACVLSWMSRPHQSLRVALMQPRDRGGNLLAQRYRQRTEALAAGRTTRRWSAREVLSCPLPPISA